MCQNNLEDYPFTPGQTPQEYSATIKQWLPQARILVDKLPQETAQGVSAGVYAVLNDFPDLAHNLEGLGTIKAIQGEINKKSKAMAQDASILAQDEEFRRRAEPQLQTLNAIIDIGKLSYDGEDKRRAETSFRGRMKTLHATYKPQQFEEYWAKSTPEEKSAYLRKISTDAFLENAAKAALSQGLTRNAQNLYASASPKQGVMLSKWFDTPSDFEKAYARDVKSGYHPAGTAGHAAKAVSVHEMGHQIDYFVGAHRSADIQRLFSRNVKTELSEYGATNTKEMIAESFAEVYVSPTPRQLSKDVVAVVRKMYADKVETL